DHLHELPVARAEVAQHGQLDGRARGQRAGREQGLVGARAGRGHGGGSLTECQPSVAIAATPQVMRTEPTTRSSLPFSPRNSRATAAPSTTLTSRTAPT